MSTGLKVLLVDDDADASEPLSLLLVDFQALEDIVRACT